MQTAAAPAGPDRLPISSSRIPLLLAAILGLAVLVRVVFAAGYQGHDDQHYLLYAATLALTERVPAEVPNLWIGRIGGWLPIAAFFRLFGMGEWVGCLYAMSCSVASVALVFFTGRLFTSERGALLAAFLAAVFPLDLCYATTAYIDVPVGFFMQLALYYVLEGQRRGDAGSFLLAGLSVGWAYLCRETAVLMALPFGLFFLVRRWSWQQVRALGLGITMMLVAEQAFWGVATGDPLHRYRAAIDTVRQELATDVSADQLSPQEPLHGWVPGPAARNTRRHANSAVDFALMFLTNEEFGVFWVLAWVLLFVRVGRRTTGLWELIVWIALLAVLHGFFPWRYPYTLARDPRYYACLTGAIVILIADSVVRWRASVRWLTVSALVVTSFVGLAITQHTRTLRLERMFAEAMPTFGDRPWLLSTGLASFLMVRSGAPRLENTAIHFLEEGPRSDGWHSLHALWPDAPLTTGSVVASGSYVALFGDAKPRRIPARWRRVAVLATPVPQLALRAVSLLARLGAPEKLLNRLVPWDPQEIHVYSVG